MIAVILLVENDSPLSITLESSPLVLSFSNAPNDARMKCFDNRHFLRYL